MEIRQTTNEEADAAMAYSRAHKAQKFYIEHFLENLQKQRLLTTLTLQNDKAKMLAHIANAPIGAILAGTLAMLEMTELTADQLREKLHRHIDRLITRVTTDEAEWHKLREESAAELNEKAEKIMSMTHEIMSMTHELLGEMAEAAEKGEGDESTGMAALLAALARGEAKAKAADADDE